MIRLLCVTVYVFNETGSESLMLNHRKLGKWLSPGGKVDPNELPDEAALRETFEETGLRVRLLGERPPVEGGCVRPYGVQVNVIKPGELEHIDLIYAAVPEEDLPLQVSEREAEQVTWMPIEKIMDPNFNTFDSVRTWVSRLAKECKAS